MRGSQAPKHESRAMARLFRVLQFGDLPLGFAGLPTFVFNLGLTQVAPPFQSLAARRQLRHMLQSRHGSVFSDGGDYVEQTRPDGLSRQRGSRGVYQKAGLYAFFIGEFSQQGLGRIVCELVEGRESVRQLRKQFFQGRIFMQILLDRRLVEFEVEVVDEIGAAMFREICQRSRSLANQAHRPLEPGPSLSFVLIAP
jgi:hypothetical protein